MIDTLRKQKSNREPNIMDASLNCIIFQGDSLSGKIYIMQSKTLMPVGDTSFWSLCGFAYHEIQQIRKMLQIHHCIWLYSKLGVGVLYDVFYPATGNLFYLHICDEVLAGKAIRIYLDWKVNMVTYPPDRMGKMSSIIDYMHMYEYVKHRFHTAELLHDLFDVPKAEKEVTKAQMKDVLIKMAIFSGCPLTIPLTPTTCDARIYDSAMFRYLCFCWLTLLQGISTNQKMQARFDQEASDITPYMSLILQCQCCGSASLSQQMQNQWRVMMTYLINFGEQQNVYTMVNHECETDIISVTMRQFQKSSQYMQGDFKDSHGQIGDFSQFMRR